MMTGVVTAGLVIFVIISYWTFFFGAELISSLQLYLKGNGIYHELRRRPAEIQTNITGRKNIPLIMHRMWRDDSIVESNTTAVPTNWTKAFRYCNEMYRQKGWTTVLWTDESIRVFMETHYPHFIPIYDSYPYNIQRVDAARYFILYHYGGLYMDLDVGCQKHMDLGDLAAAIEYSGMEALIPLTEPFGLSNDVMFATKSSPFFKKLIDALATHNKWYGLPYLTVMYSTGPMFLSLQYMHYFASERKNGVVVLHPEMYSEKGTRYFKHLRGSTWHRTDAHTVQWLTSKFPAFLVAVLLVAGFIKAKRIRPKNVYKIV